MSYVSELLILLTKNELMSESFIFLSESLIFWQKTSDSLRNQLSEFPAQRSMNFKKGDVLLTVDFISPLLYLSNHVTRKEIHPT